MNIFEGGNVFKNGDGQPLTQRINQTDIDPTVTWLEELTGLDLHGELDPDTADQSHPQGYPERWLGSTGKKESSGDLDLGIDAREFTKDQMVARLSQWCQSHGFKPEEYIKKSGSIVHFKTPITGRPQNGYVQTDFTFLAKPKWSQFVLSGGLGSQYQGRERNVMMNSIAKAMGYKLNQNDGIMDRATNQLITDDPDKVAKILLNPRATRADLRNVEGILKALEKDPKRDAKLADFKQHMERAGLPFLESTTESADLYQPVTDVNFLAKLRDRIVNQGMRPLIEAGLPQIGGRAKGIEHIEDLVFRNGTRGIQQALEVIGHMKGDTRKSTTVKWDGKPALVFGRMPDGGFVLTDVAGFTAKGYDGLFRSPRQVIKHLAARDTDAKSAGKPAGRVEALGPMYQQLFPMLQAAVPENFKGFIQGDLLYTSTPPERAGNLEFQPNTIAYSIPASSKLGQEIADSDVGIAIHTRYKEPGASKQPLGRPQLNAVNGLLLMEPIAPTENVKPTDSKSVKQLKQLVAKHGRDIDGLFNPVDLRAAQVTDLPKLCIDYINWTIHNSNSDNKVIDTFDPTSLLREFLGHYLRGVVSERKYQNIGEYVTSPRSNQTGIAAAFSAFILLHNIKMDILQQLDRQVPGQEGWVVTVPGGTVKFVNRFEFTRANRLVNPK